MIEDFLDYIVLEYTIPLTAWIDDRYQDYLDACEDRFREQMKMDAIQQDERTRAQVVAYMKENGHG